MNKQRNHHQTIKIEGYSVGDSSVGIGTINFSIDTGLEELDRNDRIYIIKTMIRDMWELHDNGDLRFDFSDEIIDNWDYNKRFTYELNKIIMEEKVIPDSLFYKNEA